MKNLYTLFLLMSIVYLGKAQNTFPATGNVGIGTTTPSGTLHIHAENPTLYMTSGSTSLKYAVIRGNNGVWLMGYAGESGEERISIGNKNMQPDNRTVSLSAGGFERLKIAANGNIGIGVSDPETALDILSDSSNAGLRISSVGKTSKIHLHVADGDYGFLSLGGNTIIRGNGNTSSFEGNVGIGTTAPTEKLSVNGKIRAKEIKVETGWSDYIFDDDYDLPSLKELKRYIQVHNHLPGIPTEAEVQKEGVNLGEISAKLLAKIEELTLYIIEQDKQLEQMKKSIDDANGRYSDLQMRLLKLEDDSAN